MSKFNGTGGSMTVGGTAVAELAEWSTNESAENVTGAAKGDATVIGEAGIVTRTAAVNGFLDPSDAGQASLTIGATVTTLIFYLSGTGSGLYSFTCSTAVVMTLDKASPMGLGTFSAGLHLNAALTQATIA
mgnify:CR=1 FL=1